MPRGAGRIIVAIVTKARKKGRKTASAEHGGGWVANRSFADGPFVDIADRFTLATSGRAAWSGSSRQDS